MAFRLETRTLGAQNGKLNCYSGDCFVQQSDMKAAVFIS
jgi:hypothetical protein